MALAASGMLTASRSEPSRVSSAELSAFFGLILRTRESKQVRIATICGPPPGWSRVSKPRGCRRSRSAGKWRRWRRSPLRRSTDATQGLSRPKASSRTTVGGPNHPAWAVPRVPQDFSSTGPESRMRGFVVRKIERNEALGGAAEMFAVSEQTLASGEREGYTKISVWVMEMH